MASNKVAYATSTAITITLNSLANAGVRECTAVDNGTNLYLDAWIYVACKLATGTPTANTAVINVYAYASEDGTNYQDNCTGSDAAVTLRSPTNLKLLGQLWTPTSGALTYKGVFSFMYSPYGAFGGLFLPRKWGIVVQNTTGVAFDSTGCSASYSGVYSTSA